MATLAGFLTERDLLNINWTWTHPAPPALLPCALCDPICWLGTSQIEGKFGGAIKIYYCFHNFIEKATFSSSYGFVVPNCSSPPSTFLPSSRFVEFERKQKQEHFRFHSDLFSPQVSEKGNRLLFFTPFNPLCANIFHFVGICSKSFIWTNRFGNQGTFLPLWGFVVLLHIRVHCLSNPLSKSPCLVGTKRVSPQH